jgi:hypothetical protein
MGGNPWKSTRSDSKSRNAISTYINPFSVATANPKIPDGKGTFSAGVRLQNVQACANDAQQDMTIFLFPGLTNGCYIEGDNRAEVCTPGGIGPPRQEFLPGRLYGSAYKRHIDLPVNTFAPAFPPGTPWAVGNDLPEFNATIDCPIKQWRLVSQATKVMLTNNYDNNEGWFEAFRTTLEHDEVYTRRVDAPANDFNYFGAANPLAHRTFILCPRSNYLNRNNAVEHPSYVSGKLRDIGKYIFQLKPVNSDHRFVDFTNTTTYDKMYDTSYDTIIITIHGRPMVGAAPGSSVVVHTVSNQEVIYDEGSALSRFHSECYKDLQSLSRAQSSLQYNQKAAKRLLTG